MHDRSSLFRLPAEGIVRATNPAPTLDPSFAVGREDLAGRFLASAVLRSGRALRGYWRGLRGDILSRMALPKTVGTGPLRNVA